MENMKELARFFEPDPRNLAFVRFDLKSGEKSQITLEDHYRLVSRVELHSGVPQDVRSYFEAVKTLVAYGWLYYPFYALSQDFSAMAVEFALRIRLPKSGNDKRGLAVLFQEAEANGLIAKKISQWSRSGIYAIHLRMSKGKRNA